MSDTNSAFDAMMDDAVSATPTPAQATAPDPAPGQPRDDAGRFAAKAEPTAPQAAAPAPAAPTAPAATPTAPEPKEVIPLATALEWRDGFKATKRELDDLKKRLDNADAGPAPQVPSATADPEGFAGYMADLANRTRMNTVFEVSETMAREKHGEETVSKAMDWAMERAKQSPSFAAEYISQKHPIDWAVKQQKRYSLLDAIGDDPEAYIAAEIAKRTAGATPPSPQSQGAASLQPAAQPAPTAPRSIASASSAGGTQASVPSSPGNAFEAAFPT